MFVCLFVVVFFGGDGLCGVVIVLFYLAGIICSMATSEEGALVQLVSDFSDALKQSSSTRERPIKLDRFKGKPVSSGDPTLKQWLDEVDIYCRQCNIPEKDKARVVVDHLAGSARIEVKSREDVTSDYSLLVKLHNQFGGGETLITTKGIFQEGTTRR